MSNDEQLLQALTALKNGDFSVRLPTGQEGTAGEIAETFNATMEQLNAFSSEVLRIMRELAPEGKFGGQAYVPNLSGNWRKIRDAVNTTAGMLTYQVRDFAHALHNLAHGKTTYVPLGPAEGETEDLRQEIHRLIERYGKVEEKA